MQFGQLGRDGFIAALAREFPEVAADIDPEVESGLLHLEMGALARAAQAAIDEEREPDVRHHFAFADHLLADAGLDLANAIYVSYLEYLHFDGHRAYAEKLMPSRLHAAWVDLNRYLDDLSSRAAEPEE